MKSNGRAYLYFILSALAFVVAWMPQFYKAGAIAGWLFTLLMAMGLRYGVDRYAPPYLAGIICYTIGFCWLPHTIIDFGGFNMFFGLTIFSLFVLTGALQWIVFMFFYRRFQLPLAERMGLRGACTWAAATTATPRIFLWEIAHSQINFTPFIQIADIAGTTFITFVMFWVSEALVRLIGEREKNRLLLIPLGLFFASLLYGYHMMDKIEALMNEAREQEVVVVQGNIPISMKHEPGAFAKNRVKYETLSKPLLSPERIVIWPETAIMNPVFARAGTADQDNYLPKLYQSGASMLVGALTYDLDRLYYNSAVAIFRDGTVPYPYHKQILMPFGEYTPFGNIFPWLKEINSTVGDFGSGKTSAVLEFPMTDTAGANYTLKISPLICYEDIVPSLGQEGTRNGAELLVNMTNDGWFGESFAPWQHHLIAAFRAVENHRFFIRSTNSGYTAIVNPLGHTTAYLDPFHEGTLLERVKLLSYKSLYTSVVGEIPWYTLTALVIVIVVFRTFKRQTIEVRKQ